MKLSSTTTACRLPHSKQLSMNIKVQSLKMLYARVHIRPMCAAKFPPISTFRLLFVHKITSLSAILCHTILCIFFLKKTTRDFSWCPLCFLALSLSLNYWTFDKFEKEIHLRKTTTNSQNVFRQTPIRFFACNWKKKKKYFEGIFTITEWEKDYDDETVPNESNQSNKIFKIWFYSFLLFFNK